MSFLFQLQASSLDRNTDKKFAFLSEESRAPDYRPVEVRRTEPHRQSPRIDHRPLGAGSYRMVRDLKCFL